MECAPHGVQSLVLPDELDELLDPEAELQAALRGDTGKAQPRPQPPRRRRGPEPGGRPHSPGPAQPLPAKPRELAGAALQPGGTLGGLTGLSRGRSSRESPLAWREPAVHREHGTQLPTSAVTTRRVAPPHAGSTWCSLSFLLCHQPSWASERQNQSHIHPDLLVRPTVPGLMRGGRPDPTLRPGCPVGEARTSSWGLPGAGPHGHLRRTFWTEGTTPSKARKRAAGGTGRGRQAVRASQKPGTG